MTRAAGDAAAAAGDAVGRDDVGVAGVRVDVAVVGAAAAAGAASSAATVADANRKWLHRLSG